MGTRRSARGLTSLPVIRRYEPRDFDAVSDVCLRTGRAGGDASGWFASDELVADIFVRPYVLLEPQWAWVVDDGVRAVGYIVAVPDTSAFVARYRSTWLPHFAETYEHIDPPVTADENMRHLGFTPERMLIAEVDAYPAHLHIDLLPEAQGSGCGRQLIDTLVGALRSAGIPGLHLSLDPTNRGAAAFYERLGFGDLPSSTANEPVLGIRLEPVSSRLG